MVERSFAMIIGHLWNHEGRGAYLPLSPSDPPDRIATSWRTPASVSCWSMAATALKAPPGVPVIDLEQTDVYNGPSHTPTG